LGQYSSADRRPASRSLFRLAGYSLNFFELVQKTLKHVLWVGVAGLADGIELHHIKPTLPHFQTADQIAFSSKPFSQLALAEPCLLAHFHYGFSETFSLARINGLFHAAILRAGLICTQNASKFRNTGF
jgi:hypothetical protein